VVGGEDPLLSAREDEHVVRVDGAVRGGDRLPQRRRSGRLGVAAPELEQAVERLRLELQKFAHRSRLAVAARQHVLGGELVAKGEALDLERRDLHLANLRRRTALRTDNRFLIFSGECVKIAAAPRLFTRRNPC
jgi:hypothetical protein